MNNKNGKTGHYYRSLTRNYMLMMLLVSFIPLFLVSSIIYYQFHISYHDKVYAHLKELVHKHEQHINDFLNEKLSDIRFLSESQGFATLSNKQFLQQKLVLLQKEYAAVFVDLGVINAQGRQLTYAGPFMLGQASYANTDWFKQVMKSEYVISDVFLGLRGLPHFIIAVKRIHDGKPWILRATIDFVAFNNLVENIRIGKTGFAFILNRKGELQTKTAFEFIPTPGCYGYFFDCIKDLTEDVKVEERIGRNGQKNIYVAAFLKNKDWLLVYNQVYTDAFSEFYRVQQIAVFILFAGGVGLIVMAFFLSRRMVRRLKIADSEMEIMNQQVIETGKLATVGELAAGIAHEINNPVAIMVEEAGWIQDLLEEEEFHASENLDEFDRALKQINTQGKRCKEITHKLLSFARKTDSRIHRISVDEMLEDIISLSAQRAKYSNVAIKINMADDLPEIMASASEMQQVFLNLINNALDAMDKNGGEIRITAQKKDNALQISLADDGPGIPKANLARIFDPFFTTKMVGRGTGLGLSICYGIINKMGGRIDVQSVLDMGTTFTISIPISAE